MPLGRRMAMSATSLSCEVCMMKSELRRRNLPVRSAFMREFTLSFVDQKKWLAVREQVRKRVSELESTFPAAFGLYDKEKRNEEFVAEIMSMR